MGRKIVASYTAYSEFKIPKNIPLLSTADNIPNTPWSWYIKWNTLFYIDGDGNEKEIDKRYEIEPDFKNPDNYESDDTDTDSDSDDYTDTDSDSDSDDE